MVAYIISFNGLLCIYFKDVIWFGLFTILSQIFIISDSICPYNTHSYFLIIV